MNEDFLNEMTDVIKATDGLKELRVIKAYEGGRLPFPVTKPVVCLSLEKADRMDFLLGYDECVYGEEKLCVSVLCDESIGAANCESISKEVCKTILDADKKKIITSICVEKCMYDKTNFAYKVIMRLSLREKTSEI